MSPSTVRARQVWTPRGVLSDGVVECDAEGRILAVRPARAGDPDRLDGLLLPGLINAHLHLEVSWARGRLPHGVGLPSWIGALMRLHAEAPSADRRREAASEQALRVHRSGTAAVSDVSNAGDTADLWLHHRVSGIVQHEALGFERAAVAERLPLARADAVRTVRDGACVITRPTGHAVYSTAPELLRAALVPRGGVPGSLHVSEDPAERRLLGCGEGPLAELLDALDLDWRWWEPPGVGPFEYVDRLGLLSPDVLLVHGVDADAGDRARVARRGAPLCLCPRSNLWIGGRLPDVRAWLQAGARLCLGTDSLASCADLDVLGEIPVLHEHFPEVPMEVWLHLATAGGADALQLASLGRIEAGRSPGLVGLPDVDVASLGTRAPADRMWMIPASLGEGLA